MGKQQLFYIHGGNAYSDYEAFLDYLRTVPLRDLPGEEHQKKWSGSLADDLGNGFEVFTPSMPNKQNAKYAEWKIWFERYIAHLRDGVILLGWSQGGMFLVKYLIENRLPFVPKALILVAAPYAVDDFGGGEDGGDFGFETERLCELHEKVQKIIIVHSEDDFVVPFAHAEKYHRALPAAELMVFKDKNHFLIEAFPELVEKIRQVG